MQEDGKGTGKLFTTNQMWKAFNREREKHPVLNCAVPHGLRENAVIFLRRSGYTALQISDMVGMSVEMVEHYCRYADRKASGQAILRVYRAQNDKKIVKRLKNGKQKLCNINVLVAEGAECRFLLPGTCEPRLTLLGART